jgi:hypothetical protein
LNTVKRILITAALVACGSDPGTLSNADNLGSSDDESTASGRDAGTKKPDVGRGSSGNNSSGDDDTCETATVGSRKTTPDMLIVLDRSGSMAPSGNQNGTDRWRGSVDAVLQVTEDFSKQINFGLLTFPSFTPMQGGGGNPLGGILGGILGGADPAQACAPGTVNVEVGPDSASDIAQSLMSMTPGGLTPTAGALNAALMAVGSGRSTGDQLVPPKYVLLLTDGDPNCSSALTGGMGGQWGGGGGGIDTAARQETIAAIEKLRDEGVQTFVVGYQTAGSNFVQQLDAMAQAGGTGDMMHRSVSSAADLTETFNEIAGRALSCSYKLENPVDDPAFVRVTVKGSEPMFGNASDGWVLGADKQTVTLTGAACDAVQAGASFSVEVACEPLFVQ